MALINDWEMYYFSFLHYRTLWILCITERYIYNQECINEAHSIYLKQVYNKNIRRIQFAIIQYINKRNLENFHDKLDNRFILSACISHKITEWISLFNLINIKLTCSHAVRAASCTWPFSAITDDLTQGSFSVKVNLQN